MKVLDLFSGIGGFRSGFEKAGFKIVGFVEWDKWARKSYKAIYNTEGEYEGHDIQEVKGSELPRADVWTFGSPCTDCSLAGKLDGLVKGKHSSMFFEVIRLLKETNWENKPKYLLMENVKNLLSSNGGWDFARVLLEMESVGYDVEWNVFNSTEFTQQNRERVYIVGHLRTEHGGARKKVFPIGRADANNYDPRWTRRPDGLIIRVGTKKGYDLADIGDGIDLGYPKSKLRRGRVQHQRSNTLTTGGQLGVVIPRDDGINGMWIRKFTPLETWRLQGFEDRQFNAAKNTGVTETQLYKQSGNSVTVPIVKLIADRIAEIEE